MEKDRGLEGWRVGGVAKNLRSKRAKDLEKKGFKESRIRGVKWRKIEGWKVGGLEGWLHLYPSKHLIFSEKKGIAIHLTF